jgi:acyl-homoserine lactone synthase
MHCDRKRIFYDALGWKIPVAAGIFEIDQFDNDDAVYLLDLEPGTDRHLGSARLLPTEGPHILGSLFSALCHDGVPRGPHIWEITRFCAAPRLRKIETLQTRHRMGVAFAEFALRHGIRHFTCVAELPWIRKLQEIGWRSSLLGEPRQVDGEQLAALLIEILPETLIEFRLRTGHREPVLETRGRPLCLGHVAQEVAHAS